MPVIPEGLDPVLPHLVVVEFGVGQPAAELDRPLIHQPPDAQGGRFFHPGKAILLLGQPGEFPKG